MSLKTFLVCECFKNIEIKVPVEIIVSRKTVRADDVLAFYAKNNRYEIKNFIVKDDLEAIAFVKMIGHRDPIRYLHILLIPSSHL